VVAGQGKRPEKASLAEWASGNRAAAFGGNARVPTVILPLAPAERSP